VGINFELPGHGKTNRQVRPLLARLGGAEALRRLAASDNAGGFDMGEVTSAGMRMMAAGLSMGQIENVSREVMAHTILAQILLYAREQVGAETADKAVVAIPGLLQFM
jgi:hypothetical protein